MADEVLAEESWFVNCAAVVIAVRQRARELGLELGLDTKAAEMVAIAVSELANNIVDHAGTGGLLMRTVREQGRLALVAIASDRGPGIPDVEWALTDGCSSTGSLGCGLPAVRRLMDEFRIDSAVGRGTVVSTKKWLKNSSDTQQWRSDGNAGS